MKNIDKIVKNYTSDDLNQRVNIYTAHRITGQKGNTSFKYDAAPNMTLWASVLPYSVKTNTTNATSVSRETDYSIVIRYRADITGNDIISWAGKHLKILGQPLNVNGKNKWLQVQCQEII